MPELTHPVKRILMTADAVGGVWVYALELARALQGDGAQIWLATMGTRPTPEQLQEARSVRGLEVVPGDFKLEWMADPWSDVERAGQWLLDLETQLAPDIVHLNGYCHGDLPWKAPVLMVAHSCVLSWWQAVRGEPAPPTWERYRQAVAAGLQAATMVVAPTQAMLSQLARFYGPLRQTRVIANGRDPHRFVPGEKEALILTAGRLWDQAKNVAALERVAPRLPWPVYVAGADQHPEGGRAQFHNVRLLGALTSEAMAAWLARAAIFALPARYEPFGLSVLEAALSGCALVLGDIPSLREIWEEAACFVAPDDSEGLRELLRRLIQDRDRRQAMAARARARALTFTPGRLAAGYRQAYQDIRHWHACMGLAHGGLVSAPGPRRGPG